MSVDLPPHELHCHLSQSPRFLLSFSLPTHLLGTTFGPGLREQLSPEHGVSRMRRREN